MTRLEEIQRAVDELTSDEYREFRKWLYESFALRSDVRTALEQIEFGATLSNDDAKAELRRRFTS